MNGRITTTIVGVLLTALGASACLGSSSASTSTAEDTTLGLYDQASSIKTINTPPKGQGIGDVTIILGVLSPVSSATQVGTSISVCTTVSESGPQVQCHGTLTLKKGTLIDTGNVNFTGAPHPVTFGITGGTGAYDDSHGQVIITPAGSGIGTSIQDTLIKIDID